MLKILFKDEYLCVIDKPAGYVVHKTRGAEHLPVVLQLLRDQLGQFVFPVHRTDAATSGALVFALSSEMAAKLQIELQKGSSVKKYTGLCRGVLSESGEFNRELQNEKGIKKTAITRFRLLQKFSETSLVEFELMTGRRHQIRRHLAHAGHHLVGDVNYGKGWLNRRFREQNAFHRMFLHCHFLSFTHPISGERVNVHSEMPDELQTLILKLR